MNEIYQQISSNADIHAAIVFCVAAAIGQFAHAMKKWGDGEVGSPFEWLTTNLRHTVSAAIGNLGGMILFIQTGVLGPMTAQAEGWWAIFLFGFMNGFSTDSALNKTTPAKGG